MNFSDHYIAKINSFLGLQSIDPFVPFDEFLEKNHPDLMQLLESKKIIVFDVDGHEVDISVVEKQIIEFYEEMNTEFSIDPRSLMDTNFYPKKVQKIIAKIEKIEVEEKDTKAHRESLITTLNVCDEGYKHDIQKGIDLADLKIKKIDERRKSLLFNINKQLKLK